MAQASITHLIAETSSPQVRSHPFSSWQNHYLMTSTGTEKSAYTSPIPAKVFLRHPLKSVKVIVNNRCDVEGEELREHQSANDR
jgi:hypothetical protein